MSRMSPYLSSAYFSQLFLFYKRIIVANRKRSCDLSGTVFPKGRRAFLNFLIVGVLYACCFPPQPWLCPVLTSFPGTSPHRERILRESAVCCRRQHSHAGFDSTVDRLR